MKITIFNSVYRSAIIAVSLLFFAVFVHTYTLNDIYEYNVQTAQGMFSSINHLLNIEHADSWRSTQYLVNHEYAHHMYNQIMDGDKWKEWEDLHNNTSVWHSQYAKTNAKEDFAELVAISTDCTIRAPEYLDRYEPEKIAFMYKVMEKYE